MAHIFEKIFIFLDGLGHIFAVMRSHDVVTPLEARKRLSFLSGLREGTGFLFEIAFNKLPCGTPNKLSVSLIHATVARQTRNRR